MIWLHNEISLFKQNIEMLRVNQRVSRLAYLWGVLGLIVSKFFAYLIFGLLVVLIQGSSLQDSQYLSYIYFGCLQIIHVIATIFLLKRRLNDCGSSVNDTLRMYKNDDIRMYNFNCITDTIVEVITTCNTYTLLTVHLL